MAAACASMKNSALLLAGNATCRANGRADGDAAGASGAFLTLLTRAEPAQRRQGAQLFALFERQQLTDVTLVLATDNQHDQDDTDDDDDDVYSSSNEVEIAAHRVVLATSSAFFHALFTSGMRESRIERVPLPGVDARAFRLLLRYMYLGELALSGDNVLPVLVTADRLEMTEVVDACCAQLMLRLGVDNCVDVFVCCRALVHRRACRLLARAARAFMRAFAVDVRRTPAFQRNLLLGDASVVHVVGDAVTRSTTIRRKSDGDYCDVGAGIPAFSSANRASDDASSGGYADSGMVNSRKQDLVSVSSLRPPSPVSLTPKASDDDHQQQDRTPTIFAIGGFNGPCALKSVELLDFHSGTWYAAASMSEKRSYSGAAVSDAQKIYVMGGACNSRHLASAEMFDPEQNVWTPMPDMPTARSYLGAAFLDGFVYAVGGFNGLSHLRTVERFNVNKQEWEGVAPLQVARSGLAVVVMHGKLIALGGYDGRKHLSSVEVYDPRANQWQDAPAMTSARNGPAAIACARANSVLVFGGEARHGVRMSSSEMLELSSESPEMGDKSDGDDEMAGDDIDGDEEDASNAKWREREPFVDSRSGHAAFSFLDESFVFAVGGSNRKDEYLDAVHRFDFVSRAWTLHSHMRAQRCGLNVAVVRVAPGAKCFDAQREAEARRTMQ